MTNICEVPLFTEDQDQIDWILKNFKHIAIVGMSNDREKPSFRVGEYLNAQGYNIYPVNPRYDTILGLRCYESLLNIDYPIEIVDIFRKKEAVPYIVEEAIQCGAKVVWMQLGIVNNQAAERALNVGLKVVMDRCIMAEHKALPQKG